MLELLAPAGSPEGVVAAVQSGADSIYMGFGDYNARRNAKNFSPEEFAKAAEYCRVRGVKIYVTLNTLATDRELPLVEEQAKLASRLGADAILVQDLGVMRVLRQAVPDMPIHASTQMSVHNLEGVKMAAAMGATRVVLARELSRDDITYICENSPIEVEAFAHGALCMCYSGQCYMSAVIGRRSGNRGLCAQPCRLPYTMGGHGEEYPLSLKDSCLVGYLSALEKCGVTCLKIEGRMKRPEYAAIVTGVYSRAIKQGREPSREDLDLLAAAFSRQGFTDGYFRGRKGPDMFGIREDEESQEKLFATVRKNYLNGEYQRVPVRFAGIIKKDEPARIAAEDDLGNMVKAEGERPEPAFHRELTHTILQTQLYKTGGTPFICKGVKSSVERNLSLSASAINDMRRTLLSELMEKRKALAPRREDMAEYPPRLPNPSEPPVLNISVLRADQLSPALAGLDPYMLYIPIWEVKSGQKNLQPFLDSPNTTVAVTLPRVILDGERKRVEELLKISKNLGITEVLAGNIGHIMFARQQGFAVRGDYGLNIYNSQALGVLPALGVASATLSFEMRMEQIRDVSKSMDTELIVYGRLPLMLTENCIIKKSMNVCGCDKPVGLTDRNGFSFPVVREFGCRNVLLNSKKLFLADKTEDYLSLGLWGARLAFTTENAGECVSVSERYLGIGDFEPSGHTRGLYYRGVE